MSSDAAFRPHPVNRISPPALVAILAMATILTTPAFAQQAERYSLGLTAGRYSVDADHVAGTLAAAGIAAEVRLKPWLDVAVEILRPGGTMVRDYVGESVALGGAEPAASRFVISRFVNERQPQMVISGGVSLHPRQALGRFMPRVFVGVADHRVRDRTVLEHLVLPPGVTLEQVNRALPQAGWRNRHLGGPSIGASLDVAVTRRLSVGPEFRYDYASLGDEINNVGRTSIRTRWIF